MQDQSDREPNRLIKEKSPYLLQHAYNPVDWFPWSNEAFEKAKAEDKPLFVSIGYSSCHWCHVMEKECFSDKEVAELMNQAFVCVKVDREERPDIDGAYMAVCQAMGRSCGWPLNVMMTPNKNPFFVASYIPKLSWFGMVGMLELIPQIKELYLTRRSELENLGQEVKRQISTFEKRTQANEIGKDTLDDAYEQLVLRFDPENGGFGQAPKFPSPHNLLFLLRYWNRTKEKNALSMVEKTLQAMRSGGVFDQVGFGFHRYSTDAKWMIPHFEKMLYDQALLALAYIEAYQATGKEQYKLTAQETLEYVLRDLCSPLGGFYSAEDADSEGEEGKFYMWTQAEIKLALQPQDADLAIKFFGVEPKGNYYEQPKGWTGKNILYMPKQLEQFAQELNVPVKELTIRLEEIRKTLFETREKRVRPNKDDKLLVDWNGLMIAALARASQVFSDQKYLQGAVKAADFILEHMIGENGVLYHRFAKSERAIGGFIDDYSYFIFGLVELYEACFSEKYLQASLNLTKSLAERFLDVNDGIFYFTAKSDDETVPRIKQAYDGAVPSGNSVELLNLLRLARLSGETGLEEKAHSLLSAFAAEIQTQPLAHTFMLVGLDFIVGPAFNVVLVGNLDDLDMMLVLEVLRKNYLPNMVVSIWSEHLLSGYERIDNKATAYVCRGQICMPPTNKVDEMLRLLGLPKKDQ